MSAVTLEQLNDASIDAQTISDVVNGGYGTVVSRLGRVLPTLQKLVDDVEAQGGFKPFVSLAALNASVSTNFVGYVAGDPPNDGAYVYNSETEAWVRDDRITVLTTTVLADISTLYSSLAAETTARTNGDSDLAATIADMLTAIAGSLAEEAQVRSDADNAHADQISDLQAANSAEIAARQSGDSALASSIASLSATTTSQIAQLNSDYAAGIEDVRDDLGGVIEQLSQDVDADVAALSLKNSQQDLRADNDEALRNQQYAAIGILLAKLFGVIATNGIHDDNGNKYLAAVLSSDRKIIAGVTRKLRIIIGDFLQLQPDRVIGIKDKKGGYAIAVNGNGSVFIPKLKLPQSVTSAIQSALDGIATEASARIAGDLAVQANVDANTSKVNALNNTFQLKTNIHDDFGRKLGFALFNKITSRLAFAVSTAGDIITRSTRITATKHMLSFMDARGQTVVVIKKNGRVYIPTLRLTSGQTRALRKTTLVTQMRNFIPAEINHHIGYGQSLSIGTSTGAAISTTQPYGNLMLASGVKTAQGDTGYNPAGLVPLVETDVETPTAGALNSFVRRSIEMGGTQSNYTMLGTASGVGGQRIAALTDEALFVRLRQHVAAARAMALAQNKTYAVSSISWIQGEADITGSLWTRAVDYYQSYLALMSKIRETAMDAAEQDYLPTVYSYQVCAHSYYNKRYLGIAIAQWRASVERQDIVMATPCYIFPTAADNLHLTAESSWLLGEYIGRAMFWTQVKGQKWRPLEPVQVLWADTYIDVIYHVPCQPIQISTLLCSAATNSGFDIWNNGSVYDSGASSNDDQLISGAIAGVTVLNPTTIRIALNSGVTIPSNAVLAYGRGRAGDAQVAGSVAGARGNIIDSHGLFDTVVSPLGNTKAMYNASVMFEYSRENGFF